MSWRSLEVFIIWAYGNILSMSRPHNGGTGNKGQVYQTANVMIAWESLQTYSRKENVNGKILTLCNSFKLFLGEFMMLTPTPGFPFLILHYKLKTSWSINFTAARQNPHHPLLFPSTLSPYTKCCPWNRGFGGTSRRSRHLPTMELALCPRWQHPHASRLCQRCLERQCRLRRQREEPWW